MAKTPAARMSAIAAASCLAFTLSPAYAERPASSDFSVSAIPRANPNAVRNEWRGPVTTTGSVSLPQRRERVSFTYPGANKKPSLPATQAAPKRIVEQASKPATLTPAAFSDEQGLASWYGDEFHGRSTANGEVFDMHAMTAAHPTLPLPSLVRVTNEENGREVVVRVNDRGPFGSDRIIDLSKRAATELGLLEAGIAQVTISYVGPAPQDSTGDAGVVLASAPSPLNAEAAPSLTLAAAETRPRTDLYGDILLGGSEPSLGIPDPGQQVATPARAKPLEAKASPVPIEYRTASLSSGSISASLGPQVFVQVGSFTQVSNAQTLSQQVGRKFATDVETARVKGADYFRVFAGPFPSREAADRARQTLRSAGIQDGFVVLR